MILSHALKTLEDLDQENAWAYIINDRVQIGKYYRNPTRSDKQPGCKFHWKNNILWLKDWKDGSNLNCVTAWSIISNLNYKQAIVSLAKVTSSNTPKLMEVPTLYSRENTGCFVDVEKRKWEKRDKDYWDQFGVSKKQLEDPRHPVLPISSYTFDYGNYKKKQYPIDLSYAYYAGERKHKLYFPERHKPRFKGNLSKNDVWYLERGSDTLLIAKCQKCMLTIENLCDFDLTHVQAEGNYPSDYILYWNKKYSRKIIFLDNDTTGLENGKILSYLMDGEQKFIDPSIGYKDISDMRKGQGKKQTQEYFTNNFIHN